MENIKIYMAGGISSLDYEEQTKWRLQVINTIKYGDYYCEKKPIFYNPVNYYNFKEVKHRTEREVLEFDLNLVRKADLIVVNFNDPQSLGTCAELAIAYELKKPIIGINKNNKELHPWLVEFTTRMCSDLREAVEHIIDFYLN